ncbi:M28 family metallopeptidase [Parapedobacter koreensis]|uniref:Zn-dependent amino-or carboxypeptidase, M28 family n=1 Tax=Parapedobacter koreensis TaxID=332977 RepID=A0A1H7JMY5_9SPHI|nr:M28 family metallopeptidase [Parapedobacter koreensis]SEK75931.1 Zn-dependent amino-or carboxypeptidase, M28 family [Parapedobacter koreensis]
MKRFVPVILIVSSLLASCGNHSGDDASEAVDSVALNSINEESFVQYVKDLSADELLGRKPFTKGDTLAVTYIAEEFQRIGLEPGNGDDYFQAVPMVEIRSTPTLPLTFSKGNSQFSLDHLDDYVIGSKRLNAQVDIPETEVVFAGFGIVAPEYNWNDYAGLDAKGKTVVVMVNDPGFYDKTLFKGDTMTYYGRWTYKFEEAARQGATGVFIIHDTDAASYGWNVVRSGWAGPQLSLVTPDNGASRAAFEGWLTAEATEKLFELAGGTDSLISQAKKPGFKPVDLGIKTGISLKNEFRKSSSNNVLGKLSGSKYPDEYIIYSAHWDHLGVGEPVDGDSIYNGANDNASGIAALFELAKGFKSATVPPERSILFLAVTAEEQGLLGSAYYAANPVYPLNKTVANINIDALSPIGKTSDIAVIGLGQSDMDDYARRAAARQGRDIVPGGNPSAGSFFRSDHFNFAKVGVPALYTGSGKHIVDKDSTAAAALQETFGKRYHHVSDEYDETWDVSGMIADIRLAFDIGYSLSQERTFPQWKAGSEFKEMGDSRF